MRNGFLLLYLAVAEIISTIVVLVVVAIILGYIFIVGYVPKSIPMHSPAGPDGTNRCNFVSPNLKFSKLFGQKMPFNMTCGDFNKLLQAGGILYYTIQ